jgi:uncharacterized protein DUF1963
MRQLLFVVLVFLIGAPAARADDRVREAAVKAGYGDIADRIGDAARPAELFRPARAGRMPAALGTSRTGGDPDLPEGAKWPRCKGRPQSFLAQVRVRDLPAGARELRRAGGVLLFFTDVVRDPDEPDYAIWAGDCSAVIHARPGAALERVRRPDPRAARLKPVSVRFAERPDVPGLMSDTDYLMPPLQDIVPPHGWEKWFDFRYSLLYRRPYVETRLLGYTEAPNGGNRCSARAERAKATWRHLFTVGPDDAFGFEVADAGRVQMLISPADLRAGRFDRVCGVFDSA